MHRLLISILALIFMLSACKERAPKGILKNDQMVDLLVEVHIIDGYLNSLQIDSSRRVINPLYQNALDKYGLDSALFEKNLKYYLSDPIKAEKIYESVNDKLTMVDKDIMYQDSVRHAFTADSIRRVERFKELVRENEKIILRDTTDTLPVDFIHRVGVFNKTLKEFFTPPHLIRPSFIEKQDSVERDTIQP